MCTTKVHTQETKKKNNHRSVDVDVNSSNLDQKELQFMFTRTEDYKPKLSKFRGHTLNMHLHENK